MIQAPLVRSSIPLIAIVTVFSLPLAEAVGQTDEGPHTGSPADHLPQHIRRLTWFGERADWSHDGQRILFLSKTFGDAMEVEVASGKIRNLTAQYLHHGYTRALYLSNGDILLSGPRDFDPTKLREARVQCYLSVLRKDSHQPAVPLDFKCFEGPAVSRRQLKIAWTLTAEQSPEVLPESVSQIHVAEIVYDDGKPRLDNERVVLDSRDLPFSCTMETQNFVPPVDSQLTFAAYDYQGTEVALVDLASQSVTNLSNAPDQYDEPEGIYPDGRFTLVECDKHNQQGSQHVDLWKLRLDGGRYAERLTFFSDYPGYKASNPVVSDDGQRIAFQMAKSGDEAGVGHGLFILQLSAAR